GEITKRGRIAFYSSTRFSGLRWREWAVNLFVYFSGCLYGSTAPIVGELGRGVPKASRVTPFSGAPRRAAGLLRLGRKLKLSSCDSLVSLSGGSSTNSGSEQMRSGRPNQGQGLLRRL